MTLYDFTIVIAAVILFETAISRLNAIMKEWTSKRWWIRRIGFLLVMIGSGGTIGAFFTTYEAHWYEIVRFCLFWGVAMCWITTPGEPPFWKHISKNDEAKNAARLDSLAEMEARHAASKDS